MHAGIRQHAFHVTDKIVCGRLDVASDDYRRYLMKKKPSEVTGTEDKMFAVDALGAVMIKHGEEFGEDSAYGQSLVSFGRAHCNIATFQESFAVTFEETFVSTVTGPGQTEEFTVTYGCCSFNLLLCVQLRVALYSGKHLSQQSNSSRPRYRVLSRPGSCLSTRE